MFIFQLIEAIGFGFVMLGLMLKIPPKVLGIKGLIIVCGHNLLPIITVDDKTIVKAILSTLYLPFVNAITPNTTFLLVYPPLPWLGIMYLGFGSGFIFNWSAEKRKAVFIKLVTGLIMLFLALRFSNLYGDPASWTKQKSDLFTFLLFMNVTRYPPSFLYCSITLGIMFILLYFAEDLNGKIRKVVTVYGKLPLFYY